MASFLSLVDRAVERALDVVGWLPAPLAPDVIAVRVGRARVDDALQVTAPG
ncbi:MAG: hypothetical protein ABSB41_04970 [Anaerolineales bacterium]